MTAENTNWFEPIPVADYQLINKESGQNVPQELPVGQPIGGLDIRCGPILKLCGTLEDNTLNYRATILLVIKQQETAEVGAPRLGFNIGPSFDSGKPPAIESGEFPGVNFYNEDGFQFWRFHVNLQLVDYEQKVKYFINDHYKQAYQFFVPAKEQSMNVVSYSCNGFSLGCDPKEYQSSLWFDVLQKHGKQHYHVMLGGGDQIYSDSIKVYSEKLGQWMKEKNPLKKMQMRVDEQTFRDFQSYYLNHYMAWFGKGYWVGTNGKTYQALFPLTMSQIPSINIYDDHDIIDGFGSYHNATMKQDYFKAVGNVAYRYYMLFQHHMAPTEDIHNLNEAEPSWILANSPGPFINQKNHSNYVRLGKEIGLLGLDCRTERKLKEIVKPDTYKLIFKRLEKEIKNAPDIKHLLVMLGVPILYPRLVWLEWILNSRMLKPLKVMAGRGIINKGLVNEFDGGVEVLDDLNDHWCSKNHKRERNYLVKELIDFAAAHGVRVTILSGDVHLCCIGRIKSKIHHYPSFHLITDTPEDIEKENINVIKNPELDPRLIFNVTSSAIINAPPPDAMATLLNKRSKIHHFSKFADEDVVPLFTTDPSGNKRDNHRFLNKRNWADLILAKQSVYGDQVDSNILKFPSPALVSAQEDMDKKTEDSTHTKYPLLPDSLVTTLHVEDDPNDFECKTAGYEVLIPKLDGKFKLGKAEIKHLS